MHIQNLFNNTIKVNSIKNFSTNPFQSINFKGGLVKDSFELQSSKKQTSYPEDEILFAKEMIEQCDRRHDKYTKKRYEIYLDKLIKQPRIAPCFDPRCKNQNTRTRAHAERSERLYANGIIDDFKMNELIASIALISHKQIHKQMQSIGLIKYETVGNANILNLDDKQTRLTSDILKQKRLKTYSRLASELNVKQNALELLPFDYYDFDGKLSEAHFRRLLSFLPLIDLKGENSINSLKKAEKLSTKKSKYYDSKNVPAAYLQKLGFANVSVLRKLVQNGNLIGRVELIDTPEGKKYQTMVNFNTSYSALFKLRDNNPNISKLQDFARELNLSQKELYLSIFNDELEIIPEYICEYDSQYVYIDKSTPKNKEFIKRKLFEQELALQLKENERKQKELERIKSKDINSRMSSMRMKLVWYFCPNTRRIASQMAIPDRYLCYLIKKDAGKEEELTKKEEAIVNKYRKSFWNEAGTDELKEAFKKADEILRQYSQFGLDSIEDEEIKEILKMYEN